MRSALEQARAPEPVGAAEDRARPRALCRHRRRRARRGAPPLGKVAGDSRRLLPRLGPILPLNLQKACNFIKY